MRTVALPIETKVREFHGKLWLGLNLVERGYDVVLGPVEEIRSTLDLTAPYVYVTKDPADPSIDFFDELRSAGIAVCGLDPEGGVLPDIDSYTRKKAEALNHMDAYFAWGTKQADALREIYGDETGVFVTGNPRFDLLHPPYRELYETDAAPLADRYGDYVLVNTNFGIANPIEDVLVRRNLEKVLDNATGRYNYNQRVFHLFIEALLSLQSRLGDTNFVVRPHPSENIERYESLFGRYENVHVEFEGDVRSWIAGAKAVIHHDCTTGIESALMEKPVFSYRPVADRQYEAELPQLVSEQVFDREDLFEKVSNHLHTTARVSMNGEQLNQLKQYFHNADGPTVDDMCDAVADERETSRVGFDASFSTRIERSVKSSGLSKYVIGAYDATQRVVGDGLSQKRRRSRSQRFPGLGSEEIAAVNQELLPHLDLDRVETEAVPRTRNSFVISSP